MFFESLYFIATIFITKTIIKKKTKNKLTKGSIGIAFDIDGVLIRGKELVNGARESLKILNNNNIPYIFVTNGGGVTEANKAIDLTSKFDVKINEDQILLSHTPYKDYVSIYKDKRVLIIGSVEVAKHYGFKYAIDSKQLYLECPSMIKSYEHLLNDSNNKLDDKHGELCAAVFCIGDSYDWALEIQALTDVLRPINSSKTQRVALYCCNSDVLYKTEHLHPRYPQGAFVEAFRCLFEQTENIKLNVNYFGKPFGIQFKMAVKMLQNHNNYINNNIPLTKFVMIGDNPLSDIKGSNNADDNWYSVLVRTGMFGQSGEDNDIDNPAYKVCSNALEAVNWLVSL
jgi:HAD superfamily hydrolase (TIGR01456 family)